MTTLVDVIWKTVEVQGAALYLRGLAGPPYPEPPGGPPPGKEGKEWNSQTARWRNPVEGGTSTRKKPGKVAVGGKAPKVVMSSDEKWEVIEGPVDEYVEHTGKMWGSKVQAMLKADLAVAAQLDESSELVAEYTANYEENEEVQWFAYGDMPDVGDVADSAVASKLNELAKPVPGDQLLYRGIIVPPGTYSGLTPGTVIDIEKWDSFARSKAVAWQFADPLVNTGELTEGVLLQLTPGANTLGVGIIGHDLGEQHETIVRPEQSYVVKRVGKVQNFQGKTMVLIQGQFE